MKIFVDTSALFAVIASNDPFHSRAAPEFERLLDQGDRLITSNYVMLETTALIQSRIGMEGIQVLEYDIRPVMEIEWIDQEAHDLAYAALIAANRRQLSLVDMTSFSLMRNRGIDTVFAFDVHFEEQGFSLIPKG